MKTVLIVLGLFLLCVTGAFFVGRWTAPLQEPRIVTVLDTLQLPGSPPPAPLEHWRDRIFWRDQKPKTVYKVDTRVERIPYCDPDTVTQDSAPILPDVRLSITKTRVEFWSILSNRQPYYSQHEGHFSIPLRAYTQGGELHVQTERFNGVWPSLRQCLGTGAVGGLLTGLASKSLQNGALGGLATCGATFVF